MENRQHHLNLSQWENAPSMPDKPDELLFYLDPVGTIPPRAGDLIHFEDLTIFVKESKKVAGSADSNWRCVVYGDDLKRLRRKLS